MRTIVFAAFAALLATSAQASDISFGGIIKPSRYRDLNSASIKITGDTAKELFQVMDTFIRNREFSIAERDDSLTTISDSDENGPALSLASNQVMCTQTFKSDKVTKQYECTLTLERY
jgi:hypothetical protein